MSPRRLGQLGARGAAKGGCCCCSPRLTKASRPAVHGPRRRRRGRYLRQCLEQRAAPDVWFLADPAAAAADLRACLSPQAPSVATVCQVLG